MIKLVQIDDEFNQPSGKLIEVGAVVFLPDGKLLDAASWLVDPKEPISEEITQLTSINGNDILMNSISHSEAATKVSQLKAKWSANPIPIVWGAGKSNDIRRIYDGSGVQSPFAERIIDVKGIYQMLANSQNAGMRQKVGLESAIKNVGLQWDYTYGPPHRALADQLNTAKMYQFLSKCMKGGYDIKKSF